MRTPAETDRCLTLGRQAFPEWPAAERIEPLVRALTAKGTEPIDAARAREIYLVGACLAGVPEALALLERDYLSPLAPQLERLSKEADFAEEALQHLRELLLLPTPARSCKLAEYAGQGPLGAWLRVVATRVGLRLMRDRRRFPLELTELGEVPELVDLASPLQVFKGRDRQVFSECFEAALEALPTDSRLLLKLYFSMGLSVAEIAKSYRLNRSSVWRRIQLLRRSLAADVHARLAERLDLSSFELDSLIRFVSSQVSFDLSQVLKRTGT